jgi:hypothetical protein
VLKQKLSRRQVLQERPPGRAGGGEQGRERAAAGGRRVRPASVHIAERPRPPGRDVGKTKVQRAAEREQTARSAAKDGQRGERRRLFQSQVAGIPKRSGPLDAGIIYEEGRHSLL